MRLDLKQAVVYYGGCSYLKKGDRDKAIADYTEAISLNLRALRRNDRGRTSVGFQATLFHSVCVKGILVNDAFATTHWSMVISAGRESSPDSKRALELLCRVYWQPLYAYVRCRVADVHEAQDLTQAFFAELLEKNYVGAAEPERGRFRAFLVTAFKHFLSKQWEKAKAQKRGGGRASISLDFESADSNLRIEPTGGLTPEEVYDRQWAIALLGQIMERLEREFETAGKAKLFEQLKGFMIGDHEGQTYAQAAERLDMTEGAARKAGSRMRRRYRELLREEIALTVSGLDEVEDEIRNLFAALEL